MKQSFLLISIAILLLYTSCTKQDNNATATTGSTTQNAPMTPSQQKLLDLVNQQRTSGCHCGTEAMPPVGPVSWNSHLADAAEKHSKYMDSTGKLDHTGANGSDPGDRIKAEGYNWTSYGENIAENYSTEEEVIKAWLASPGHCKNIMDKKFTEMGVGTSGKYWTQDFATKD